jgi:hypothetical protein
MTSYRDERADGSADDVQPSEDEQVGEFASSGWSAEQFQDVGEENAVIPVEYWERLGASSSIRHHFAVMRHRRQWRHP